MGGLLCCCARIAWFQSMELVHANNCATVFEKSTGERSDLNVCVLTRLAFLQKLGIKEPSKYRFSSEVLDLTFAVGTRRNAGTNEKSAPLVRQCNKVLWTIQSTAFTFLGMGMTESFSS
jgi:hypothetical protein